MNNRLFPEPTELQTESDVEQKLILPLLVGNIPCGFGYYTADILTKLSIRRLEIGKGTAKKLYYPDYLIILAGMPVLVVEAKAVGEPLDQALYEARLYGSEINALFPHNVNPCLRVIACNGDGLWSAPIDTSAPDIQLSHGELSPGNTNFAKLVKLCSRECFQSHVDTIRQKLRKKNYRRPVTLVGGPSFQNEELPQNTFGATIVGDYGHIFNPVSTIDREKIVREAYIGSLRRQRYIEPIDRMIRNAVTPTAGKIEALANSAEPKEIATAFRERKNLGNQIMLLIGSVGAGKSTFVDYFSLVALPRDLQSKTVWLRLNLNEAPLLLDAAYNWIVRSIISEFRSKFTDIDFDDLQVLMKVFSHEIASLKKGPLALLDSTTTEYKTRLADRLIQLQSDPLLMAKGIAKFLCNGPNVLLVIVLDNCDKRNRDEQLTMFQVAQWVRSEFGCLVFLPLRDVTYDLYRHHPPLDTALKQFVFRIEPPQFTEVLHARVRLALNEMGQQNPEGNSLSYQLPNGIKVTYPAEDQALYLASILRSLYAHDRFVRQVMTGLAGRDVRRALQIFLDFCMSGHIGEDQIFKIRFFEGQHVLPISMVARVLLRMHRRFYDGDKSYLKNIFQCNPNDALPDYFVRQAILNWLNQKLKKVGPAGVEGFHRAADMILDLAVVGHDAMRVREELKYLVREGCIVPEHLRLESLADDDLFKISASGIIHLQLMVNPEYLAACAEDAWMADEELSMQIAERLGKGPDVQYSLVSTACTAKTFVAFLKECLTERYSAPETFLESTSTLAAINLQEAEAGISAAEVTLPECLFVGGIPFELTESEVIQAFQERGISIKHITLMKKTGSQENRGFAFIHPTDKAGVLAALDLDGVLRLRDRKIRINDSHKLEEDNFKQGGKERPLPELSKRVYIGNLPFTCGPNDVRGLLSENDITATDIYIIPDKGKKCWKGCGFVEVASLDEAARVIGELNGLIFQGRRLLVRPADSKEQK